MRIVVALCFIALALARVEKIQKVDTHTVLSQMETTQFGSSFLNFLSLQSTMKNDGDVTVVQETVADYLDQLQNAQAEDDAHNEANEATCDELITSLTRQVNAETEAVTSLENSIETNNEILEGAKRELNLAASDLDETVASLEAGSAQREAENARWVDIDYEHENSETQLDEAIKLIKHLIHGVTFAQIKPRFEKIQDNLRQSSKFGSLFKPLILSLSELATKLNYENVVQIIDLLNNILSSVRQSRADYARTEQTQADDWADLSAHLTDQKNSLTDKKARLNALITATESILEQSRASLEFHRNQLVRLQAALEEQENWCETVSGIYEANTLERSQQTDTLTRLQEHLTERFGSVAEYLQTRQISF